MEEKKNQTEEVEIDGYEMHREKHRMAQIRTQ